MPLAVVIKYVLTFQMERICFALSIIWLISTVSFKFYPKRVMPFQSTYMSQNIPISDDFFNGIIIPEGTDYSEEDIEEILSIAFNDDHRLELNRKVTEALQDQWDIEVLSSNTNKLFY